MADFDLSSFAGDVMGSGAEELSAGAPLATGVTSGVEPLTFTPGTIEPGQPSAFSRFAGDVGAGLGKEFSATPLKAFSETLGLGATGFGIANQLRTAGLLNQQTQQVQKSQKAAQAAAAPAVDFGKEQLATARAGKLPGPMEAAVEQWKQQAKADMRARLASMGLGNSTDITSEESKIELMGESMKAQLLQGQEAIGLEGLQTGVSAATGAGASASQQQALLANLIAGANAQIAKVGSVQP